MFIRGNGYLFPKLILILLSAFIAGCFSSPETRLPSDVVVSDATQEQEASEAESDVVTHALEDDSDIIVSDDPHALVELAEEALYEDRAKLYLQAGQSFLDANQPQEAQDIIRKLELFSLSYDEESELSLLNAQLEQRKQDHIRTIYTLNSLPLRSNTRPDIQLRRLLLLAKSQQSLGRHLDALLTTVSLDSYLESSQRLKNQYSILHQIQALDALEASLLSDSSITREYPELPGWLTLSVVEKNTESELLIAELEKWRHTNPGHPAHNVLLPRLAGMDESLEQYKHIAMLLPLTSSFGNAAKAFYDGFVQAHQQDSSPNKPILRLHDIGQEKFLLPFYYDAAIAEGADFVVGPLGKSAVDSLLSEGVTQAPTLVIGDIDESYRNDLVYGISLSPEDEAFQIAEHAFSAGHRHAAIIKSDSEWGQRVALAFHKTWQALGGKVVEEQTFASGVDDYSQPIQKFLLLGDSTTRERLLSAQLGLDLKFTPRRRDDIDVLFIASNAAQARSITPQLRFFQAHDLPMYATSNIFTGKPDPAIDADLDGLVFGDLPWMFDFRAWEDELKRNSPEIDETTEENVVSTEDEVIEEISDLSAIEDEPDEPLIHSPYQYSVLDRLYALGLESYSLIPRLNALQENTPGVYRGNAVTIGLKPDGNSRLHLKWAQFKQGIPVILTPEPSPSGSIIQSF